MCADPMMGKYDLRQSVSLPSLPAGEGCSCRARSVAPLREGLSARRAMRSSARWRCGRRSYGMS